LIQTKYNKSKNSCFGEFRFSDSLSSYGFKSIYDLTTNKEVATDSVFSLLDQKNTGKNGDEIVKEYEKIKGEIFLN
jgi:hypothetical protein